MRTRWALPWLLSILSCSAVDDRVAIEDLGGADLRVVVATSGAQSEARILDASTAYRFELEPLSEVFDRGDALRVYVLGYRIETIEAAFPELEGRAVSDIIGRLTPHLGPAAPGRFTPPPPDAVLFAQVEDGGAADVDYATRPWEQVQGEISLFLELPGELACPPLDALIRTFSRDDPGRVCIFKRNQACEWARTSSSPCADQARIFGTEGTIVEQPDGTLRVGNTTCMSTAARDSGEQRGETAAYACGNHIVAAQEQPIDTRGRLWSPIRGPTVDNAETLNAGQWIPVDPGVLFGFDAAGDIELRRIGVGAEGQAIYEPLSHPVVDSPVARERRASSVDGRTITLSGNGFERNVGLVPDQCFRRVDGTRPLQWAPIESVSSQAELTLATPIDPFASVLDWQVVGDPGQDFVMSPQPVTVKLPADTGALERLSAAGDTFPSTLLVHGRNRTFTLPPVTRFAGDTSFLSCPIEIPRPADLVGPMVIGPDMHYGLLADGVQLIRFDGTFDRVLASEGEVFTASWTLTRTTNRQNAERVVVYREGVAHLFDPSGSIHDRITVDGRIVGVLPGPTLLYLPAAQGFAIHQVTVLRGQISEEIALTIPAVNEGDAPAIEVTSGGIRDLDRTVLVGFSSGGYAGVLDTRTGLSSATEISPGAKVVAVFEGDGGDKVWAAVSTSDGAIILLELPLPAE